MGNVGSLREAILDVHRVPVIPIAANFQLLVDLHDHLVHEHFSLTTSRREVKDANDVADHDRATVLVDWSVVLLRHCLSLSFHTPAPRAGGGGRRGW